MAAAPARTSVISALRASRRAAPSSRICTANFASSSRVGLDFTRPLFAESKTTTTTTTTTESSPIPPSSQPAAVPSFSSAEATVEQSRPPYPTPSYPSAVPRASAIPHITPSTPSTRPRRGESRYRYAPIQPLDDSKTEKGLSRRYAEVSTISKLRRFTHILHVKCGLNNVHLSFVDATGNVFGTVTAGSDETFKKSHRSTYEAAYQAALKTFDKIVDFSTEHHTQVCVAFNGLLGQQREAIVAAISSPEGREFARLIVKVEDRTPIAIGFNKPRGDPNH